LTPEDDAVLTQNVSNYPVTQCHIPEELNPQTICRYRHHEGISSLKLQGN